MQFGHFWNRVNTALASSESDGAEHCDVPLERVKQLYEADTTVDDAVAIIRSENKNGVNYDKIFPKEWQ